MKVAVMLFCLSASDKVSMAMRFFLIQHMQPSAWKLNSLPPAPEISLTVVYRGQRLVNLDSTNQTNAGMITAAMQTP